MYLRYYHFYWFTRHTFQKLVTFNLPTMNIKTLLFIWIISMGKAKTDNKITKVQCNIDTTVTGKTDAEFKNEYLSATGIGVLKWFKLEWKSLMPYMVNADLQQMCSCAFQKLYSQDVEKSKIKVENDFAYCRAGPFYISIFNLAISNATTKCTDPSTGKNFFIVEADKFYPSKCTQDLFALEMTEEEFSKNVRQGDGKRCIDFPAGSFVAIIPRVNLKELALV